MRTLLSVTHRLFYDDKPKQGGADIILNALSDDYNIDIVEHDLMGKLPSIYRPYISNKKYKVINIWGRYFIIRLAQEVFSTLIMVRKKYDMCLSSDPFCGLICIILQRLGRVRILLNHCVDFSEKRFSSKFLSYIYVRLALYVAKKSSLTTVVSKRAYQYFVNSGVPSSNLMYMPNSPIYVERKPKKLDGLVNILIVAKNVSVEYNYFELIKMSSAIIKQGYDIKVLILGEIQDKKYGKQLFDLIMQENISSRVELLGYVSGSEYDDILKKSHIGVTFYDKSKTGHFAIFGDSLKIREYASYGLPIITEDIYETAIEGSNLGCVVVVSDQLSYVEAIKSMLIKDIYEKLSVNCLNWAKNENKLIYLEDYRIRINTLMF